MGISREITHSVILSNESPLYSPGLSSRMQFKSPMGSGIVKHLGGVWIPFFNHSISVTHHSKYPTHLEPSLTCHYSIFFTLFVGPIPITWCSLFFFFPVSLNLVKKEKEKKKPRSEGRRRSHLV